MDINVAFIQIYMMIQVTGLLYLSNEITLLMVMIKNGTCLIINMFTHLQKITIPYSLTFFLFLPLCPSDLLEHLVHLEGLRMLPLPLPLLSLVPLLSGINHIHNTLYYTLQASKFMHFQLYLYIWSIRPMKSMCLCLNVKNIYALVYPLDLLSYISYWRIIKFCNYLLSLASSSQDNNNSNLCRFIILPYFLFGMSLNVKMFEVHRSLPFALVVAFFFFFLISQLCCEQLGSGSVQLVSVIKNQCFLVYKTFAAGLRYNFPHKLIWYIRHR